jgi:hypothetical protein
MRNGARRIRVQFLRPDPRQDFEDQRLAEQFIGQLVPWPQMRGDDDDDDRTVPHKIER